MPNQVFEEKFIGKYDGVIPATLLPHGGISDGANMRKVSPAGGWKARKGCALHNTTTVDSTNGVNSLHQYTNPRSDDYHFLAQCNSLLYYGTKNPPDLTGTTFGTSLGIAVGTTPGFSCVVREDFFYADGSGRPVAWGGDTPYCSGFLVQDTSESAAKVDYTRVVTDGRTDTGAVVLAASDDFVLVLTNEPASAMYLTLGTNKNSNAVTMTVEAWRATTFVGVSNLDDLTETGGNTTLAQSGRVFWDASASDTLVIQHGIMGYMYKVGWSGAMSNSVDVTLCTVERAAALMTNKWNGVYEWVAGCRFFDASEGESGAYIEALGMVTNESESQYLSLDGSTLSDFLYIKTVEPVTAFGLGMVTNDRNTEDKIIDKVEYWDGDGWTTVGTVTDTTKDDAADSSFSQSGTVSWQAQALTPKRRTFEGDLISGYWYRVSWAGTLSATVSIYMILYAPHPEVLPAYDGCIEFKGRLLLWGDPEYPNRLRFSASDRPDCFSGTDSGYTDPFGDMKKILCAVHFQNELLVFKEDSVWLMEGYNAQTFGLMKIASNVGLASPKTAYMVEVGAPGMHEDEPMSIAIWQDIDGIYVFDGRKPRKVSMPMDHYFNIEYSSTVIAADEIRNRQAGVDPLNNEYHFLLSSGELVYNYATDEWYPPWNREIDLDTWISLRGTGTGGDRYYTYGGSSGGFICRLENDTTDKTTTDVDKIITHSLKTRAIGTPAGEDAILPFEFTLRRLWAKLKARAAGSITTKTFKDLATSGTTQSTPQALSMINTNYSMAVPGLDLSEYRCSAFQVEFSLATADQEMEIWSMPYEVAVRSTLGVP